MFILRFILLLLTCLIPIVILEIPDPPLSKLLVVSFDGFSSDFFHRGLTPNFLALKSRASFIKKVVNVFPTQTFPNHFSIATGLYAENHGVLASEVFDRKTNSTLKYSPDLFHYNDEILPIWVLNQQNGGGRHSGTMMWPGSDFTYKGVSPTFSRKFDVSFNWTARIDEVVSWFKHPKTPANLVLSYFEDPDKHAHTFGPNSKQVNEQIKKVDGLVLTFMNELRRNGLSDVNVIFTSDHGMSAVNKDRIIYIRDVIRPLGNYYGFSSALQVYPHPGKEEELYKKLKFLSEQNKTFNVYKKAEIPDSFHYKKCQRAPPVLLLSKLNYAFEDALFNLEDAVKISGSQLPKNPEFGVHGYDPSYPEMQPFLMAIGPVFNSNFTLDRVSTVDYYLLFADILGLSLPPYKLDGRFDRLSMILRSSSRSGTFMTGGVSKRWKLDYILEYQLMSHLFFRSWILPKYNLFCGQIVVVYSTYSPFVLTLQLSLSYMTIYEVAKFV